MLDGLLNELSVQARADRGRVRRRMHYRILNVSAVVLVCCMLVIALIVRR